MSFPSQGWEENSSELQRWLYNQVRGRPHTTPWKGNSSATLVAQDWAAKLPLGSLLCLLQKPLLENRPPPLTLKNTYFVFWPCREACGIFVPKPGTIPACSVLERWSPNHWTAREAPWRTFDERVWVLEGSWVPSIKWLLADSPGNN